MRCSWWAAAQPAKPPPIMSARFTISPLDKRENLYGARYAASIPETIHLKDELENDIARD
jgi:hypothetical protein